MKIQDIFTDKALYPGYFTNSEPSVAADEGSQVIVTDLYLAKGHWRIVFKSVGEPQFSFKRLQVTKNQLALVKHFKTIIVAGVLFSPPGPLTVIEIDGQRKFVGAAGALQS